MQQSKRRSVTAKSPVRAIFSLVRDWPRLLTTLSTNSSKNIRPLHVRHYPTFLMMSLRFKRHLTRFVKCFATVLVDQGEDVMVGVSNTSGCYSAITRCCSVFWLSAITSSEARYRRRRPRDVRPIAVGSVFRRTVAKLACSLLRDRFGSYFSPFQFGVSTPGGSERVVHLLQLSLSQHPDWVLLKTDARNAFNSVSRQRFLDLVNEHFPTLQAFVYACYAVPPSLVLLHEDGFRCIKSEEGVQQGDPLGPFLFSLALQSCLVEAHAAASEGFVISYLDDAVIGGPVESLPYVSSITR